MRPKASGNVQEVPLAQFVSAFSTWVSSIKPESSGSLSSGKKTIHVYMSPSGPAISYTTGNQPTVKYRSPEGCAPVIFNSLDPRERNEIYGRIAPKETPAYTIPSTAPAAPEKKVEPPPATSAPVVKAQEPEPVLAQQPATLGSPDTSYPLEPVIAPAPSLPVKTPAPQPTLSYSLPSSIPDPSALNTDATKAKENFEKLVASARYMRIPHTLDPEQDLLQQADEYRRVLSFVSDKADRISQIARSTVPEADQLSRDKPKAEENIKKLETAAKVLGIQYAGDLKQPENYQQLLKEVCEHAERISDFCSLADREIAQLHPVREQVLLNAEAMMMLLPLSYPVLVFYKNAFPELKTRIEPLLSRIEPVNQIELLRQKVQTEHDDKIRADANQRFLEQRYAFMSGLGTLLPEFVRTARAIRRHTERGDYLRKLNRRIGDTKAYSQQLMVYQEALTQAGIEFKTDGDPSIADLLYRFDELNPTLKAIQKQAERIHKQLEDNDAYAPTLKERMGEGWQYVKHQFRTFIEARTPTTHRHGPSRTRLSYDQISSSFRSLGARMKKAVQRPAHTGAQQPATPAPPNDQPSGPSSPDSAPSAVASPAQKPAAQPHSPPVPVMPATPPAIDPTRQSPPTVPMPPQIPAPPVKTAMPNPVALDAEPPQVPPQPFTVIQPTAAPPVPMPKPAPIQAAQNTAPAKPVAAPADPKPSPAPLPVVQPLPEKNDPSIIPSRPNLVFKISRQPDPAQQPQPVIKPSPPGPTVLKAQNPPKIQALPSKKQSGDDEQ